MDYKEIINLSGPVHFRVGGGGGEGESTRKASQDSQSQNSLENYDEKEMLRFFREQKQVENVITGEGNQQY